MSCPSPKSRGRPFQPGNPGRAPGSKNTTTQVLGQLAEGQAERLLRKVLEQALAGDVASQRMVLDRSLGEGQLTPEESTALSLVVGRFIQIIELQDHQRRIAALEQARGKRDASTPF